MADSSLSIAVAEIARNYSRERHVVVNASFASAKAQDAQITEGGAADILITPQQSWIDGLKEQGLVDIYSQTPLARNRLALVGPLDSPVQAALDKNFPAQALIGQMGGLPHLLIGDPDSLLEGGYAKAALAHYGVEKELAPYTVEVRDSEQLLDMVVREQAYGLVFYSSTVSRSGLRTLGLVPENAHTAITYFAVVIAGDNMDEARKFLSYLTSGDARQVLRENGFVVE